MFNYVLKETGWEIYNVNSAIYCRYVVIHGSKIFTASCPKYLIRILTSNRYQETIPANWLKSSFLTPSFSHTPGQFYRFVIAVTKWEWKSDYFPLSVSLFSFSYTPMYVICFFFQTSLTKIQNVAKV